MTSQRLLVSVRGSNEAKEAVAGGAHIIDAEYPKSALGTQYPLNIVAIREAVPSSLPVSTNIGEMQFRWSTSAQAALGVALAGADIIKVGLGGLKTEKNAITVMRRVVRNVKYWFPNKILVATLFADTDSNEFLDSLTLPNISKSSNTQGALIDTFHKKKGKTLLDYLKIKDIKKFVRECHSKELEAWIAGSISKEQLPVLWKTKVDVICVRGATCKGSREEGKVNRYIVRDLIKTI